MNKALLWKRFACILAAVLLLSAACAAGEIEIEQADFEPAEPVRAENAEAFSGMWRCRYYSRGGITVTYEDLIENEMRYEHPGYTDEEIAAKVAEKTYEVEIGDGIIRTYTGGKEDQALEVAFGDGKLVYDGDSEVPGFVEILADGYLRVTSPSGMCLYFEKERGEEFLFRGKIRWGMTQEEVQELEGEGSSGELSAGYRGTTYPGMPVSRYTGELTYVFGADGLVLATYTLVKSDAQAGMSGYIKEALDAVYGERAEAEPEELYRILEKLRPGEAYKEGIMNMPLVKWAAAGDTAVLLAENDYSVYIVYVSPELMNGPAAEPVDTTGL